MKLILNSKELRLTVQIVHITAALCFLLTFKDFNREFKKLKKVKKL